MRTSNRSGVEPLLLNLERYVHLSADDRRAIARLKEAPLTKARARTDIAREGDHPGVVRLMVSGWAGRYKDLPDGRRQIVGFFIPGDFCDLNVYILQAMDHSIGALTSVSYLAIPPGVLEELTHERPRLGQALLWHELVHSSVMREWLLNLGQRSAFERLAHLFVEMYMRMRAVGLTRDHVCEFPITQTDLAEATGLTPVHVNRTLQELRREGLIELAHKELRILDYERLKKIAMFNPNYLHLDHEGRYLDAND
jgi:CRP-like cAMP-binding protein